jgi:hypothetical protein
MIRSGFYPGRLRDQRLFGQDLNRAGYGISAFLAPHTHEPRDVPQCGAVSVLTEAATLQGGGGVQQNSPPRLNIKIVLLVMRGGVC